MVFDIDATVPFDYNHTHNYFIPGDPKDYLFHLEGTAARIVTGNGHELTDAYLDFKIQDAIVDTTIDTNLLMNFTDQTMSSRVHFELEDFSLLNSTTTSKVAFSGELTAPFELAQTPWMHLQAKVGLISGSATFSSTSFVVESFDIAVYPIITNKNINDPLDPVVQGNAQFHFKRPDIWTFAVSFLAKDAAILMEIIDSSLADINDKAVADYVRSSTVVDASLLLKLASRGEYFRIEVDIESTEMAPDVLLGAEDARIKLIVSATEKTSGVRDSGSNYQVGFESDISKIIINDNFELLDVKFVGTADLDEPKEYPDLQFSLEGKSKFAFGNQSDTSDSAIGDLTVAGVIKGAHYPYLNKTEINTDTSLSEGWKINSQLTLTDGTLGVRGVHENGNWTFEPIDYSAGGNFRLSAEGESPRHLQAQVTGRVDQEKGDNVVTISSALGPLDSAFSLLLPEENYTIPASSSSLVVADGFFHLCISNKEIAFNNMDCVNGIVLESNIRIDAYLNNMLRPFGFKTGNATVGMAVTANLYTDEALDNTIEVESVFAGRGLALAPAVTLTKVIMTTSTDFDVASTDYAFEIEVELSKDASLILSGIGGFGDENGNAGSGTAFIEVNSRLTNSFFIFPSVEILESCDVGLDLKALVDKDTADKDILNRTEWTVSTTEWTACGAVIHLPGGSSTIKTTTAGTIDVLTSEYEVTVNAKFDNIATALSVLLNDANITLPAALQSMKVSDSLDATMYVNSEADILRMEATVDVSAVPEIEAALGAINMDAWTPDKTQVKCEIETKLSNPAWNETSVKFLFSAEGFQLGPFTVDLFELEIDKNEDGTELTVRTSSIIVVLEQRFKLDGVTSIDPAETTVDLSAKFLANKDKNKLYLFYKKVLVLDGTIDFKLSKDAGDDAEWETDEAKFMGQAWVYYTSDLHADTTVTIDFTPQFANYELTIEAMTALDIYSFLPSFPSTDFSLSSRADSKFLYNSATKIAKVEFTSKMTSNLAVDPLTPIMPNIPEISGTSYWDIAMACNVTDVSDFWEFKGELKLEGVKIGDKFTIHEGLMTVELGSGKNVSYAFDITSSAVITDTFLAGKNESIYVTMTGAYDSEVKVRAPNYHEARSTKSELLMQHFLTHSYIKLLALTGTSKEPFHPLGQEFMEAQTGVIKLDIEAPLLTLRKMEMEVQLTTLFTGDDVSSAEFVCLDNGKSCFVRFSDIQISNLEDVFDKVGGTVGGVDGEAKTALSPVFETSLDLYGVNVTVSNFDNSNYEVVRGLEVEAAGTLESGSSLVSTLTTAKDTAFSAAFKVKFSIDLFNEEGGGYSPTLYLFFAVDNMVLVADADGNPVVEVISYIFNCAGLDDTLAITWSSVVSVQLPGLDAPLITTVENDFDINIDEDGTAELDADWTAKATTKLAGSFQWNPMGLEMFKLVEPQLTLHFSDDEDTPDVVDVEVDKLVIQSLNTSLSQYVDLFNPKFEVVSFDPQEFKLITTMRINYKDLPHPLVQKISGTFVEEGLEGLTGSASLGSTTSEDWWPFGHDMVNVKKGNFFNTTMTTELGQLQEMAFKSELDVRFSGEDMVVKMEGSSGGGLNEFCYMFYNIPVVSIAKVFAHVFVGENGTDAAKNFLLGDDGGVVDVEVDAAIYEASGGVKKASINVGSYSQDCSKYRDSVDVVDGHRVSFEVLASGGGNLVELWRLVDSSAESVKLKCELVYPYERGEETPLIFSSSMSSEGEEGGEDSGYGISVTSASIDMQMTDPDSLDVSFIDLGMGLHVSLGDGNGLDFELQGTATETTAAVEDGKNNSKTYDVTLYGGTTSTWKKPFGLEWLEISKGSLEVTTTSDLEWVDTTLRMQLGASFAFNATLDVDIDAVVSNGGEDVVLMARLKGNNWGLLSMLGMAGGSSDLESSSVGEYFSEIVTEETVEFGLSTVEGRFFDEYNDMILGTGLKRGVTLNVNLLNNKMEDGNDMLDAGDGGKMTELIGAFLGAESELDLEVWVGIFEEGLEGDEDGEGMSTWAGGVPPVTVSVRNRGAGLSFGDGFLEVVDWEVKAGFDSVASNYPTLEAAASMIFRPSSSDEVRVTMAGGPTYLKGDMVGIWSHPMNLTWLEVGDMNLDLKFNMDLTSGATSNWGYGVQECSFGGTGTLAGKFAGKIQAAFLDNMADWMFSMQLFYDFGSSGPDELVDAMLGMDELGGLGRRRMEENRRLGVQTCGGSFVTVPTAPLNQGDEGRNVAFLQQLLEETGYLNGKQEGYQYGFYNIITENAVTKFMDDEEVWAVADGNSVNYDVWYALCKKSEEVKGTVVGGAREWLAELKIPGWLDNTLWEARYATYDDIGGAWKKGVAVTANINVREKGMVSQALDMVGFVEKYEDMGDFSPLFQAGVYVPLFDANPTAVYGWIEANDFQMGGEGVWCNKLRLSLQAGMPVEINLRGDVDIEFVSSPKMRVVVEGQVEIGDAGVQKAVLTSRAEGTWENIFGFEGLTLTQVGMSIGVQLTNSNDIEAGVATAYVSVMGEFIIGTAMIHFTGRAGMTITPAGVPLPGKELLLQGSLKGDPDAGMVMGQAISFRDVVEWWITDVLGDDDGEIWGGRFAVEDVPEEWGLYDTYFQLSTTQVEMYDQVFPAGIAFSTGLSIFGIDCSVTFAVVMVEVDGKEVPDVVWHVEEGLEAAEELSRRKLMEEILPMELIDPSKLTNDQRKVKEKDSGLLFDNPIFTMEGIELKNINFLALASGERPILVLKFKFFGVEQELEIETLSLRELHELDLWGKLEALRQFSDTLFSLPDCMWDSDCYDDQKEGYCEAICDPESEAWYGECPKKSGTCYMDDDECFTCFGSCLLFQCWY